MTCNTYQVGDTVRLKGTFKDAETEVVYDPGGAIVFRIKDPDNIITEYTYMTTGDNVVRLSTGVYRKDIPVEKTGVWNYRLESEGTGQTAEEGWFKVERSRI